jgi:hypothetical protein
MLMAVLLSRLFLTATRVTSSQEVLVSVGRMFKQPWPKLSQLKTLLLQKLNEQETYRK